MPMMTEVGSRPEEVGEILVKVHEDLVHLKDRILSQGDLGNVDLSSLEAAIQKTEDGLKNKADNVLQQLNNQVQTLPTLDAQQQKRRGDEGQGSTETTWDARAAVARRPQAENVQFVQSREVAARPDINRRPVAYKKTVERNVVGSESQTSGLTPGQDFKQSWHNRIVNNPYNPQNRNVLSDSFGIQLPLIMDRKPAKNFDDVCLDLVAAANTGLGVKFKRVKVQNTGGQQVVRGSTVEPLAVLPRSNRMDPQLLPPTITEDDARLGILSLIERGLIPPAADLTLDPTPVRQKGVILHDPKVKEVAKAPIVHTAGERKYNIAGLKLDPSVRIEDLMMPKKPTSPLKYTGTPDNKSRSGTGRHTSGSKLRTPASMKTLEIQPMPPPTTPASGQDFKDKNHRFAIQNGKTRDMSQEFMAFKQHYCLAWGSIVTTLRHLEKMLTNYTVPIAFVNGDRLADLSIEFELEQAPSEQDLMSVIVNKEDVENLINRPGRRFTGPDGKDLAASKIQATWKMYKERLEYLDYRRKKWAAGVIAISWVMNVKMAKVRKQLTETRADQLENFRRRAKIFARNWDRIKESKRVIIHIPSHGFTQKLRESISEFNITQNTQMARLCDIKDPNVDVIYVSPVPINDEMHQYYAKLLGLKPAIDSGSVEDQGVVNDRYKIIVPESIKSFPTHSMCLSSLLKYSPRTMKRIQNLIRGREAYIITGTPNKDDLHIADYLDVPLFSAEPEVANLYSTKSGSKRIFASANTDIPPGEYDVYSLPQLQECLAQLITENLEVTRWLFKIDDEYDGRGIAYIDVAQHLRCYPWALKEAQRYGEKWSKKWAQEAAYIKIHAEIPDVLTNHARPVNTKIYPTWAKFIEAFLSQGGIIEACPPSDSVTALTVDMLIEPNGKVSIVCMGDQIHAETPFSCWGMSVPQSSVEPEHLNECCYRVAEACKARGIIGHLAIDFVTFIDPKTMCQMLWAVDLDLSYTDSTAMFKLIQFSTRGRLDTKQHYFDIPPPVKEEKKTRRRRQKEEEEQPPNTNRYAVMSTRLRHSNLSVVHYSVFFQMCRAHGIGYDIKEKQGTVFTLIDGYDRSRMGMVTIGDNLQGALATFARNLSVVHQEISAPNMQGESNFKPVIEDIESILGTTVENAEDQPMEESSTTDVDTS